jgi:hypothetical protein
MTNKRVTLKPAFLIRYGEIKPCFAAKVTVSEEYYKDSEGYLVFIDDTCQLVKGYKNEVFFSEENAHSELARQKEKHVKFCKEQIESYQRQLNEVNQ